MTAWSPSGAWRTRTTAAPLHVLWLGLLLFGLFYTHVVSPDVTMRHTPDAGSISASAVSSTPGTANDVVASAATGSDAAKGEPGGHHGGHGSHQFVDDCALGQPEQAPELVAPSLSPLDAAWACGVPVVEGHVRAPAERDLEASITPSAEPTVLRI